MEPVNCEWIEERLHRILDDRLEPDEKACVDAHLADCDQCAELLRAAESEDRALASALPLPSAPGGLASDMIAALDDVSAGQRITRLWLPLSAAAAILLAVLVAHRVRTGAKELPSEPTAAVVLRSCEGKVVTMAPTAAQWAAATAGQQLAVGTKLKTAGPARAMVEFGDRAKVKVNGNTAAQVAASGLVIESGRVFAWVEKAGSTFFVETPHATAMVRGTRFSVDCRDAGATVLSVLDGLVVFGSEAGHVEVGANMRSVARSGRRPAQPVTVDLFEAVSWAGIASDALSFAPDVLLRVRRGVSEDAPRPTAATFVVDIEYGQTRYADLRVYCSVTDADDVAVAQTVERVCRNAFRYHTKSVTFSGLTPGAYRASFRVGHGAGAVVEELDFAVE